MVVQTNLEASTEITCMVARRTSPNPPQHLDTSKPRHRETKRTKLRHGETASLHSSSWSAHIRPNCLLNRGLVMRATAATPRSCAALRTPKVTRASDAPNSALRASLASGPPRAAAGPSHSRTMTHLMPHPTLGHLFHYHYHHHHLSPLSLSRSNTRP
jgi:hypothetical protein